MKALISPQETQHDGNARVCDVEENSFPIAEPLFWVKCGKSISGSTHSFNLETKKFVELIPLQSNYTGSPVVTENQPLTTGTVDL